MRDNPRYSIIPAGAVTDPRLKGWDLKVLCLLGCHSDKLGWCEASSQGELAEAINCGRSTFQRSIIRLIASGWVQTRSACVSHSGRSYASFAYRVVMDRDDIDTAQTEHQVAAPMPDDGAHGRAYDPPDDAHGRAPCPAIREQPCPRMHGHKEADLRDLDDDEDESRVSMNEAFALTKEIAVIAGITDEMAWPPGWQTAAHRVDAFLREGYLHDDLRNGTRQAMASRRDKHPPHTIEYFAKPWAKARGERDAPVPSATTPRQKDAQKGKLANAKNYLDELAAGRSHADAEGTRSSSSEASSGGIPIPKRA